MSCLDIIQSLQEAGTEAGVLSSVVAICLVCDEPAIACSQELVQQTAACIPGCLLVASSGLCQICSDLATQASALRLQLRLLEKQLQERHLWALYQHLADEGSDGRSPREQCPKQADVDHTESAAEVAGTPCRLCPARSSSTAELIGHVRRQHGATRLAAANRSPPGPAADAETSLGDPDRPPPDSHDRTGSSDRDGTGPCTGPAGSGPGSGSDADPSPGPGPGSGSEPAPDEADPALDGRHAGPVGSERLASGALRRRAVREPHSPPPRHVCPVCQKRFPTPSKLRTHQHSHAGARPHRCGVCGRRYLSAQKLLVHARSHTGERPFVCHMCGRTFAAAAYLAQHERTHTGHRPHQCHVCGKQFTQRGTMTKHVRKVHVAAAVAAPGHAPAPEPA